MATSTAFWVSTLAVGCLVSACEISGGVATGCSSSPVVPTQHGPVRGFNRLQDANYQDDDTGGIEVSSFWGIPYADPPTGENRLRAPQALTRSWSEPLNATQRAPGCFGAQLLHLPGLPAPSGPVGSEDCLYLNVYTPASAIGARSLPVMVWIFGGAYIAGDAYQGADNHGLYDGAPLVGRHGVVVVTLDYRLGGLGFFASEELRAEDAANSTGNVALRDQQQALLWVRDNIAGFGGDPSKVTLFGESAGAFSVMWHLVNKQSWPLFHRAIMESGNTRMSWFFQPFEGHAQEFYAEWAQVLGCPRSGPGLLPCLRVLPPDQLSTPPGNLTVTSPGYPRMPIGPVIDGSNAGLLGVPLDLVRAGHFHKVPLVLGANKDDGTLFEYHLSKIVPGMHPPFVRSREDLELGMGWMLYPDFLPAVDAVYPEAEFAGAPLGLKYAMMFTRMIRDAAFQCSNRALAREWARQGLPVWLYTFSYDLGFLDKLSHIGDVHASDLLFVWRRLLWLPFWLHLGGDAYGMADIVSCRWTAFAHAADPNGQGEELWQASCAKAMAGDAPVWPAYEEAMRQYYSLAIPPSVGRLRAENQWPDDEFPSDRRCDVWDTAAWPWRPQAAAGPPFPRLVV